MDWMRLSFIGSVHFEFISIVFGVEVEGIQAGVDSMSNIAFASDL